MRFDVLTVIMVRNVIFWVVALCSHVQEPTASTFRLEVNGTGM
jgi:hypothetical protein